MQFDAPQFQEVLGKFLYRPRSGFDQLASHLAPPAARRDSPGSPSRPSYLNRLNNLLTRLRASGEGVERDDSR
jgi:hypothetical protein